MQTTKFRETITRGRTLKSQIVLYALASLLSLALVASEGWLWWTHHHAPSAATSAPVSAIQPAQVQQPTPAQVAQVQQPTPDAGTPPPNNHRHIAPGDIAGTDPDAKFSPPVAQPTPTPWQAPQMDMAQVTRDMQATAPGAPVARATPDPVAARWQAWKVMRDAYGKQQLARAQGARTDAEKGQIQAEIARWKAANPEPPKSAPTPNENEIPIR